MKWRIDSRYWLVLGAAFLWGCPIDDAHFKESGSTSSSSSSSSSSGSESSSSSSSSTGGAGGNGGTAGMGGAVSSSSSSGGGMAGAGGMGGAGGAGGGPVCLANPGTVGSCGTMNCPPCPTLVMVGTGTNGVTGTFVSSNPTQWQTAPYMNEPSMHAPALVAMPGKNKAMALIRRTDTVIRYVTWSPAGFSAWDQIGATVMTNAAVSADATDTAVHVSFYGTNGKHFYAQYTEAGGFGITAEGVNAMPAMPMDQAFGPFPASIAVLPTGPIVAYAGQDVNLYTHERDAMGVWPSMFHDAGGVNVAEVPAIATYDSNAGRDILIVFMQSSPMPNQLRWIARENGTWTTATIISNAKSTEPVLLALPNGDAILTYRDANKKVWWSRFTGANATWSAPKQPPGNMAAALKPALALGAGDAEVELLFVDDATNTGYHSRLYKGDANFTAPTAIPGATGLAGIAAATNL